MTDNSFQDVVSSGARSIRRIPVSKNHKPKRRYMEEDGGSLLGKSGGPSRTSIPPRKKSSKWGIWLIAIISIVVLYFVFTIIFSGVKVEIFPKQEAVLIDGEFTAFKEAQPGELTFKVMTLERELSGEVPATGEEFVERKASGQIIVYNNYSSASQKLIDNTRFETPDGLIYRIKDAVVVPGRKTEEGKTVPGSIEVVVYADKPGKDYNRGLMDFTIPGLKGDPRYSKFYGRSKTEMAGGFVGNIKSASSDDLARISSELEQKLKAEILEEASSVKPEGFLLFDNAYTIETESTTSNGSDGNVLVRQKAIFNGLIFNEKEFAKFIAENTIASYDGSDVGLFGLDELYLSIENINSINLQNIESVDFVLSGNTKVVWLFDQASLLDDLKGQSKKNASAILARYPSIEEAEVIVSPFWKRSITDKEDEIELQTIVE